MSDCIRPLKQYREVRYFDDEQYCDASWYYLRSVALRVADNSAAYFIYDKLEDHSGHNLGNGTSAYEGFTYLMIEI